MFYKVWSSRVSAGDGSGSEFIGDLGKLFYDDTDRVLRIGDGVTPGGIPLGGGGGSGAAISFVTDAGTQLITTLVNIKGGNNIATRFTDGELFIDNTASDLTINSDTGEITVADNLSLSGSRAVTTTGTGSDVTIDLANRFEIVSKNLRSYPYTINYDNDQVSSVVYTFPDTSTITKALTYNGNAQVTSITIMGASVGAILTKNISYAGAQVTGASYIEI